jgi:hypothetical protein
MIEFKVLKRKHWLKAQEIYEKIEAGTAGENEILLFVVSLVKTWDFIDEETGKPLGPDDPKCIYELSMSQYVELMGCFNERMGVTVPKVNAESSSSGLTPSKPAKRNSRSRRTGYSTTQ